MFEFKIEKESGEVTTLTQPTDESVTAKLNRLAREAGYDNITPRAVEFVGWGERTSVTNMIGHNGHAVFLNPVVAASIREYNRPGTIDIPVDYIGTIGVHRARIGYVSSSRITNVVSLKTTMQPIIEAGIKDLINNYGYGISSIPGYRISMEFEYFPGTFFRELEDAAGYEIRLTLYKDN